MGRFLRPALAIFVLVLVGCNAGDPEGEGTVAVEEPGGAQAEPGGNGGLGTRGNPVPIGQRVKVGQEWQVALLSVNQEAGQVVRAANQFNEDPAAGRQFLMGRFAISYVGQESGTPWVDLAFRFNGSAGNTFGTGQEDYCGVIPEPLDDTGEMFPNAGAEGNVCVSVPSDQVAGGLFLVEENFSFEPSRVFFSIQ